MHEGVGILCRGNIFKKKVSSENGGGSFRELYGIFMRRFGVMPDVLSKQNPVLLFAALESEDEEFPLNDHLKMFYGK